MINMTTPVWVLLGFAGWTLLVLSLTIGVYRWALILTGKMGISEFPANAVNGSDFYKRAMRAHANCVENLPVYAGIVVAIRSAALDDATFDALACTIMAARVVQTLVHLSFVQTNRVVSVRFSFFAIQLACMLWMAIRAVVVAL
jgi:uncharacterized membrane protein YecN with MAPEG domain